MTDGLFAEWARTHLQKVLADGMKKYISLGRILQKIAAGFIVFQTVVMGIQLGLTLAIVPWLIRGESRLGLSIFGAILFVVCAGALFLWNSERFWVRRMNMPSTLKAIENLDLPK